MTGESSGLAEAGSKISAIRPLQWLQCFRNWGLPDAGAESHSTLLNGLSRDSSFHISEKTKNNLRTLPFSAVKDQCNLRLSAFICVLCLSPVR
jgi:hypothetical protein